MKPVTQSDSNSHSSNSDLNAGRLTLEAQGAEMASGPNPDPSPDNSGESPDEYSSDPIYRLLFSDSDSDLELLEPVPPEEEQYLAEYAARLQVSDPEDEQQMADPSDEEQISDPFADPEEEEQVSDPECPEREEQMDPDERHTSSNHTHRISTTTESFHPERTAGRQPRNPRRLFPNLTQASGLAGERTVTYEAPPALLAPRHPAYRIRTGAEYLETTHPSEMATRRPRNRQRIIPRSTQASGLARERTMNHGDAPALLAPRHPAYRIRTAAEYLESTHPRRQQQTRPRLSPRINPIFTQAPDRTEPRMENDRAASGPFTEPDLYFPSYYAERVPQSDEFNSFTERDQDRYRGYSSPSTMDYRPIIKSPPRSGRFSVWQPSNLPTRSRHESFEESDPPSGRFTLSFPWHPSKLPTS